MAVAEIHFFRWGEIHFFRQNFQISDEPPYLHSKRPFLAFFRSKFPKVCQFSMKLGERSPPPLPAPPRLPPLSRGLTVPFPIRSFHLSFYWKSLVNWIGPDRKILRSGPTAAYLPEWKLAFSQNIQSGLALILG